MAGQDTRGFPEVLASAQRPAAEMPSSPFGTTLPPGLRAAHGPGKVPGGIEGDFEFDVRVFTLPGDEVAYKEIKDRGLRGEIVLGIRDTTFTKEGTYLIVQEWLIPRQGAAPAARAGGAPDIEPQAAPRRAP